MAEIRGCQTLGELLELRAQTHADRPAVRDDASELTYAELAARARAVGRMLSADGVRAGDRVVIQGRNCVSWAGAAYGALMTGATVAPLGHGIPLAEREQLLDVIRPAVVLVGDGVDETPTGRRTVSFAQLDRLQPEEAPLPGLPFLDGATEALVLSSSGTSGRIKSVPMTHWQLLRLYDDVRLALDGAPDDVWLGAVPLAHSFGFNGVLLVSVLSGASVRLLPEYDRDRVPDLIRREGLNVVAGPPTIYHDMVEVDPGCSRHARLAIVGSSEVSATEMARLAASLGIPRVVAGYGMTETCGTVAVGDLPREPQSPLPWMPVMPGVEVRICDERGHEVGMGERGRVQVRGYNVSRPYADAPDLRPGGWFDTGDVGEVDGAGRLAVAGRIDDTIIVSGFNVYPREVESVLAEHPAVGEVAVVGVPDPRRGQGLVACVVPDGADLDIDDLRVYARSRLSAYKVPGRVLVLDELPVTATGKVSRAALRRALEQIRAQTDVR